MAITVSLTSLKPTSQNNGLLIIRPSGKSEMINNGENGTGRVNSTSLSQRNYIISWSARTIVTDFAKFTNRNDFISQEQKLH
jgi:hypothetical protein